jgi:hypothetical protein
MEGSVACSGHSVDINVAYGFADSVYSGPRF